MDNPEVREEHVPVDDLKALRDLADRYGRQAALATGVVVVAILAAFWYRTHKQNQREEAVAQLSAARTPQDLEALVSDYGDTPVIPLALLKLAKGYFDNGNYDMALTRYTEFEEKYTDHEMLPAAGLGRVHCLEARGQLQEALAGFEAFTTLHPGHFLQPEAVLGRGRCLEQLGRHDEARTVYEDFIAANPDNGWTPRAEELLAAAKRTDG